MDGRLKRKNTPLTKGEKWLLFGSLLLIGLLLAYAISSYVLDLDPEVSIPPPAPMPSPNALDYYMQAHSLMVATMPAGSSATARMIYAENIRRYISTRGIVQPPSSWSKDTPRLADMQALLAKNAPVFPIVRQALNTEYRNLAMRTSDAYSNFPFSDLRGISRLLAADGDIKCLSGDIDGGVERYIELFRMGVDIPRGGPIDTASIGIVAQKQARAGMWSFQDKLSGNKAAQVARRLETIIMQKVPVVDLLQEEKWTRQALLIESFQQPGWRGQYNSWGTSNFSLSPAINLHFTSKRTIIRNYTRCLDATISNAKLPYARRKKERPDSGDFVSDRYTDEARYLLIDSLRNDTMNALLIVALALHAHHADHANYPASLEELAPKYLCAIPDDPFVIKGPLRYRRSGKSYTLYSIGPDGIDDGGRACTSRDRDYKKNKWVIRPSLLEEINSSKLGDIVAGTNRP